MAWVVPSNTLETDPARVVVSVAGVIFPIGALIIVLRS